MIKLIIIPILCFCLLGCAKRQAIHAFNSSEVNFPFNMNYNAGQSFFIDSNTTGVWHTLNVADTSISKVGDAIRFFLPSDDRHVKVDTFSVYLLCSTKDSSSLFVRKGFAVKTDWFWSLNGAPSHRIDYYDDRKRQLPKNIIVWQFTEDK